MTEIRFYHLQQTPLERALPDMLQKALDSGRRVVVQSADSAAVEKLNDMLWTFRPDSFLPHGTKKEGYAESQPVWLTDAEENPNGAQVLILTHGAQNADMASYALCCEMLDGNDDDAVAAARQRWKTYKDAGHTLTYWQQNERGGWEKKAESAAA
jgi:DNA polymerase-3 subunit chi